MVVNTTSGCYFHDWLLATSGCEPRVVVRTNRGRFSGFMKVGIIIDVETWGKKIPLSFCILALSNLSSTSEADPLRKLKRNLITFMMKAKNGEMS